MEISTIKQMWKTNPGNPKAGIEWWNSKAESFSCKELPAEKDSIAMRIIQRENMTGRGKNALDVGCGGGRFSFALEAMGAEVKAIDFSPEMIKKAKEIGKSRCSNVRFFTDNWHCVNLKEKNWEKQFDLVLAHMTPAVVSADTFLKLIEASCGWVLTVKPARRTSLILDELNKLVNAERDTKALDETIAYAFDLAWHTGGRPKIEYEDQIWENHMPLEQAIKEFTLRINSKQELSDKDRQMIRGYLSSVAVNGIVHEKSNTTVAAMFWHVS